MTPRSSIPGWSTARCSSLPASGTSTESQQYTALAFRSQPSIYSLSVLLTACCAAAVLLSFQCCRCSLLQVPSFKHWLETKTPTTLSSTGLTALPCPASDTSIASKLLKQPPVETLPSFPVISNCPAVQRHTGSRVVMSHTTPMLRPHHHSPSCTHPACADSWAEALPCRIVLVHTINV